MIDSLRDPSAAAARDRNFDRLNGLFQGEMAAPYYLMGVNGQAPVDPYSEPELWVDGALESLVPFLESLSDEAVFRPLCVEFGPYGVHFVDRIFGARVYEQAGQWWSEPLASPVGSLCPPDLESDETWALARRVAEAFVRHRTTVPVFGLPTLASALNVAVNLYGEAFLVALLDRPDDARRDLRTINDLLCRLHTWYRDRMPEAQLQCVVAAQRAQPPGFGQLCGCTNQLVSRTTYRELIAPMDDALLSVYPGGGMIHLCGKHLQHIPVWREMRSLRSVQLNDRAAEDLEVYFSGLRPDQVIYLNPTATMTAARALAFTGGRRLVVVEDPREAQVPSTNALPSLHPGC